MASDVAEFQRQAFLTCLEEVKPKLPVALASEFDQIRELIDDSDQVRKNVWSSSSSSSSLLPLLNDLNDALADCTIFADQCQEVNQTFSLLNPFHHTLFVRNMKQRLKTMNQELTHELGLELTNSSSPSIMPLFPSGRFTAIEASADYSQILGFEEQEEKIRDFLISDSNTSNAIGVYGMAGSGKTTLVLKVLNDPSVQNHFDQIIWLCLSDIHSRDHEDAEFFEVSIINFILCELGCDVDKWTEIHPTKDYLLKHLKKLLMNKRYLIVFDDVWEDNEFYSNLGDALPVENRLSEALPRKSGGKIIMTSREKEVCKKMVGDEKNLMCMQPLNRDICRMIIEEENGLNGYAKQVESYLLNSGSVFEPIWIWGPSSSATTTIVGKVLCSPSVREMFRQIIRVPISLIFSNHHKISGQDDGDSSVAMKIVNHMVKELGGHDELNIKEFGLMKDDVRRSLRLTRSLIVLEDVDDESYGLWRELFGSTKIGPYALIVTSKIRELSGKIGGEKLVEVRLPKLGEVGEGSEELIGSDGGEYVSDDIVDLCAGLPFAAKTLATIIVKWDPVPRVPRDSGPLIRLWMINEE